MDRKGNLFLSYSIFCFPVLFLATGCAAVHSDPFAKFTSSLEEVRIGADEALRYNGTANRDRHILEIAEASQSDEGFEAIQFFIMGDDNKTVAWNMKNSRLFIISPQFRSGINRLNSALISYSELLSTLAGSGIVSQTEFNVMVKNLNADIKSAVVILQLENSEDIRGIISTASPQASYDYLYHKRIEKLQKILKETQPPIVEISNKLLDAIQFAIIGLREQYNENSIKLARELRPDMTVALEARKQTAAKLVELNEDFLIQLRILEALSSSYRLLPKAHAELIVAVEKPDYDLAAVNELYENGKRMYALYKELGDNEKNSR